MAITLERYKKLTKMDDSFFVLDPYTISDRLGQLCRFSGATKSFYSVAEHSVIMSKLVAAPLRLPALLHDAAEAYIGDVIRPVKGLCGGVIENLEAQLLELIAKFYGIDHNLFYCDEIVKVDAFLIDVEGSYLVRGYRCDVSLAHVSVSEMIHCYQPNAARDLWRKRLAELQTERLAHHV